VTTGTTDRATPVPAPAGRLDLLRRISRLEWAVAGVLAITLLALVVAEPEILEAPVENTRTLVFTVGGTILAAIALLVMLRLRVPPAARVLVLGVPFLAVSWWLISPFFIDDVVDDDFATSIADAAAGTAPPSSSLSSSSSPSSPPSSSPSQSSPTSTTPPPSSPPAAPVLLGSGRFVGLAGHEGTGDAGFFALANGTQVLRLENFDIENGPDLRLYVVPGANRTDPPGDALYLGELRGNVGDQTYDLPADFAVGPGDWTVLVWCEAFSVEFVAATVTVG
jgi:hypothetical protein